MPTEAVIGMVDRIGHTTRKTFRKTFRNLKKFSDNRGRLFFGEQAESQRNRLR